jgi:parvulin-like peptidyl-prolyl isomerase
MLDYFGVNKESGKYVDVRHILITPETSKDAAGKDVITEDAWEACRKKAQEIYDQWLASGGKEEDFAELAKKHSSCGSAPNGGLLDTFGPGEMVEEFEQWSIKQEHKYGDHGLIKTQFGYHIMFYVDGEEIWISTCRDGVRNEKLTKWLDETMKNNALSVTYSDIVLANVTI